MWVEGSRDDPEFVRACGVVKGLEDLYGKDRYLLLENIFVGFPQHGFFFFISSFSCFSCFRVFVFLFLLELEQSLFEDLVYSGFNFFTAMPILLVGIFDKDVKQQTATECHKLYAVGRLGMDLNMRVRG